MIAHFSIPSENPKETAFFFASIIDGLVFDFPVVSGGFVAVAQDGSGTAVEVYPSSMAHHPGTGEANSMITAQGPMTMEWEDQIYAEQNELLPSGFHLAIETKLSVPEVIEQAKYLGWRALACDRGGVFGVIEVWIDNLYLVEVLVPEDVDRYRNFMNVKGCEAMFGPSISPS